MRVDETGFLTYNITCYMTNEQTNSEVAIIAVGGKQHLVRVGAKISVNRLEVNEGDTLKETDLLKKLPVTLKVISHELGKKINGLKFHRKVRYTRRYGHRQHLTSLEVTSIGGVAPKTQAAEVAASVVTEKKVAKKTAVKKLVTKKVASKTKKDV